ncbi:MAG: multicopper oxidase domain-containing protein, partial [Firmicutes bacterium]|nr:multicopper oxidase domain-containing protein [Bacillota bacterium]
MLRRYRVVAMSVRIVYNRFGDHDPNGRMFVLKESAPEVKRLVGENPFTPVDLVRPLVLRANQGDIIEVELENELDFNVGFNVKGLPYDPKTSEGAFVGNNPDSTVPPGGRRTYTILAAEQGVFHFSDMGNPLASEEGSNLHGLFGAIVVEPPGSTWTDPETGLPIDSGCVADIHHPFLPDVREYVTIFHDEPEVLDAQGEPPTNPMTGQPDMTHAINYRSEPLRNRLRLIMEGVVCPGCVGEEVHHDSWPFGDPATPVLRAYVGDPVRWRVVHGGVKETHIFHLHVHQWLNSPTDVWSSLRDSRELSPQAGFTFDILYGAGSLQGAYGDVIFHCHLYPHFEEGMWGLFRVHDVLEDGTRRYPDGSPIKRLLPLPDRPPPPGPTASRPGFPFFIPGTVGRRAPQPPLNVDRGFPPTPLEQAAFAPGARPGAVFVNPVPPGTPVRRYDLVAIQTDLVYNEAGWHDPEGRLFVLAEDEADILAGRKQPEPLFIHANAYECIEVHLTNKLPETLGPNAFQLLTETPICGAHVHFVKFDPISADGGNVGWNYMSGAFQGQTFVYRWFADSELRTVFFHDHLFATIHQQHGLFAALCVQPPGSAVFDSRSGREVRAGTQVYVTNPFLPAFRQFGLAVHDWVPAFTADGRPLNPPPHPGVMDDQGIMGFNYKNAPFQVRGGEPAWVFSSWVHGDPQTPVFRAYVGDPVRIRLIDGAHEESHAINIHGQTWPFERNDVLTAFVQQQHIGISEAFTLEFNLESSSGDRDVDYLYYSGGADDLWLGCWGLIRAYGRRVSDLVPLPDRPPPPRRTRPLPKKTGGPPPRATDPGTPWPPGTPVRYYNVVAISRDILYNSHGDHDPFGMLFVRLEDLEDVLAGRKPPEPLVIRASAGEGVELRLFNMMPQDVPDIDVPLRPVPAPWPYSNRVSMHAQLVKYDALGSDGATVGFNPDQTIGPGESIVYRWFAETGRANATLWDFGDLMNHRHHGLFGVMPVEPRGS